MRLAEWQQQLGSVLLDPPPATSPDLSSETLSKLELYQDLLLYSVKETLSSLFPYCNRFFSEDEWLNLADDYRRCYPNRSFHLYRCAEHFPEFLATRYSNISFIKDLARYEWEEVVLLNAIDVPAPDGMLTTMDALSSSDWIRLQPFWNPVSLLLPLDYPIPALIQQLMQQDSDDVILPEEIDIKPKPTHVLLYRDPETLKVRFFELNVLTAMLIRHKAGSFQCILDGLVSSIPELAQLPSETLLTEVHKLLQQCSEQHILLGVTSS